MRKLLSAAVLMCSLAFVTGCLLRGEPIARTTLLLSAHSGDLEKSRNEQAAGQIVRAVAQIHELQLIEKRNDENNRPREESYLYLLLGGNPSLYMTIRFGNVPLRIDIEEHHISHRSHRHRALLKDLRNRMEKAGFDVKEVSK